VERSPRLFFDQNLGSFVKARQLLIGLGQMPVAINNLGAGLPTTMLIDELLETHPYGLGAVRHYSVADQSVDVASKSIVNSCNQLCHAISIAKRNAPWSRI